MPAAQLEQMFHDAGRAYDQGKFEESASLYQRIIDDGHTSKEVLFNLGNALFRSGRIGQAVVHYRRAQYFAPRDPDIAANLRFTLTAAGAVPPQFNSLTRVLLLAGKAEWITVATIAYWLAALSAALILLLPQTFKGICIRVLAACGVALLIAVMGTVMWIQLCRRPEMVVLKPNEQALFAPLDHNATPHFALAEGSIVRAIEFSGSWVKIASGNREGWIKRDVCEPVCISGGL